MNCLIGAPSASWTIAEVISRAIPNSNVQILVDSYSTKCIFHVLAGRGDFPNAPELLGSRV